MCDFTTYPFGQLNCNTGYSASNYYYLPSTGEHVEEEKCLTWRKKPKPRDTAADFGKSYFNSATFHTLSEYGFSRWSKRVSFKHVIYLLLKYFSQYVIFRISRYSYTIGIIPITTLHCIFTKSTYKRVKLHNKNNTALRIGKVVNTYKSIILQ